MSNADDELYENLMVSIGQYGRFQKRFIYIFNFLYIIFVAMPFMNIVISLDVPDHWCRVPGRQKTNFTLEEWKNLTLPREEDNRNQLSVSKCKMFDINTTFLSGSDLVDLVSNTSTERKVVACRYGWEFDTTWYSRTAPTDESWVCDKNLYVPNTIMWGKIGAIVGTSIFGHLGDIFGRKPIIFTSLTILVIGRLLSTVTAATYPLFALAAAMGGTAALVAYQTPLTIGMEMTQSDFRAKFCMIQCIGYTAGLCLLPLAAWLSRDWVIFQLVTTLPSTIFYLLYKLVPESPLWLASQKRVEDAAKVIQEIARTNGTTLPPDYKNVLEKVGENHEKTYGVASLFKTKRLAIRTMIIAFVWSVNGLSYWVMILNVFSVGDNPFLTFFLSSFSELPAYIGGMYVADKFGRRWTQSAFCFLVAVASIGAALVCLHPHLTAVHTVLAVFIRFGVSLTFYAIYLHGMELYPTCLRQTGLAFCSVYTSIFEILGPYVVYLGTAYDLRYPYVVIILMNALASVLILFVPETLHHVLPISVTEADAYGKEQKFWSMPWRKPSASGSVTTCQTEMDDKETIT